MNDGEIAEEYPELHDIGVYRKEAEFRDDIKTYVDINSLDVATTNAEVIALHVRMNQLTIELVTARIRKAATDKLKAAEAATSE